MNSFEQAGWFESRAALWYNDSLPENAAFHAGFGRLRFPIEITNTIGAIAPCIGCAFGVLQSTVQATIS